MTAGERDTSVGHDFDRQVDVMIRYGYPQVAGLDAEAFARGLEPLKLRLAEGVVDPLPGRAHATAFLVVVKRAPSVQELVLGTRLDGRPGITSMTPTDLATFSPVDEVSVPAGDAYFVLDIDTGADTLSVTPDNALQTIRAKGLVTADAPGRRRAGGPKPGDPHNTELLLHAGLALRRPKGHRALAEQGQSQARLVLGGEPTQLARVGFVPRAGRGVTLRATPRRPHAKVPARESDPTEEE